MEYVIIDNGLVTAEDGILNEFYEGIKKLPEDYIEGKYIVSNGELVRNDNYEKEQEEKERVRISHLKCTKRVLALCLEEYGITYPKLKELIATDSRATLEWELCVELERSNSLLDIMGKELGITPEQIDTIFKFANGEVVKL